MIIDLSNPYVFLFWYAITMGILFASYKIKKSWPCLIPTAYLLIILAISSNGANFIDDLNIHMAINFLGLATSLSMFIVMDEVETRRRVISQVFKNRYKKSKYSFDKDKYDENEPSDDEEEE